MQSFVYKIKVSFQQLQSFLIYGFFISLSLAFLVFWRYQVWFKKKKNVCGDKEHTGKMQYSLGPQILLI